jgi:hypothetical protein
MNSKLETGIENIGWRFLGMKKMAGPDTIIRVEIDFKSSVPRYKWDVFGYPQDVAVSRQTIKTAKRKSEDDVYYIYSTDSSISFVDLLKHAQVIIDVNTAVEERRSLLAKKIEELTSLFSQLEYGELETLSFKWKKKKKSPADGHKEAKPKEIPISDAAGE